MAGLWLAFATEPKTRLLAGIAVGALALVALYGTLVRPRLTAGPAGLGVAKLFGRQVLPWPTVRTEVRRTRRLGREVAVLELDVRHPDGDERLFVLTRLDLGAEPDEVDEQLRLLRQQMS